MVRIQYDHVFEKQAKRLEPRLRKKLAQLLLILTDNPRDQRLHIKPLSEPLAGMLSFRITRDWRVTFTIPDSNTVRLLEVKHRKDAYR